MKSKIKKSINTKIWLYLIGFSLFILIFLWVFQIAFLDKYYEYRKTKDMNNIAKDISSKYKSTSSIDEFYEYLEGISFNKGICIEVKENDNIHPISTINNHECMRGGLLNKFINIDNNNSEQHFTINNPEFKSKTLLYKINLNSTTDILISTSLVPVGATIGILRSQLVYVTFIVLIIGTFVAYFISKNLSKPIIEITKSSLELSKGNYDKEFKTDSDIKEITELASTLDKARIELGKTDELRRDLMANVSHDLKTPLTMIKAYSEMVRDLTYNDKEKRDKNLNTIIEETDRLNNLVNDILSLSVIESKMLILEKEEFNLVELVKNILNRYDIYTSKDKYKFTLNTNSDEIIINADKAKIEQVFYNLINNAINYIGEDKEIIINLDKNKDKVRVEIVDHGKGIEEDEIDKVWDKYYKSKNHKRNTVGTGLGLSIVKRIFELHEYKYGIISSKGKGTTFYYEIDTKK